MTTDAVPGPITPIPSAPPPIAPSFDVWRAVRRWTRILLARNPFYIISAALLLWSMRRLSLDSRIFSRELPQLLFNFSSFQFYELLLAVTAIVLARRRVWYDSGLLVGLENLFICVPFLLVSQALLLQNWIASALCLAGCGLALLRVGALKRWLKELNMPASLLWSGAFLLCFNLAWPLLIRLLHKDASLPAWDNRGSDLDGFGMELDHPGRRRARRLVAGSSLCNRLDAEGGSAFLFLALIPAAGALDVDCRNRCSSLLHQLCLRVDLAHRLPGSRRLVGRMDALVAS